MPDPQYIAPERLPEFLRQMIIEAPMPSLTSGPEAPELSHALAVADEALFASGLELSDAVRTTQAGFWLLAGDLTRSHQISQEIQSGDGSFWHGVMHRREGDFDNARYWFRRVGEHPAFAALADAIASDPLTASLCDGRWDALAFVDQCERAVRRGGELEKKCVQAQWVEWQVVMADCITRG